MTTKPDESPLVSKGTVPIPDPTVLTTQLVDKAFSNLKAELEIRFSAMAEATKLVRDQHDTLVSKLPIIMHQAINDLRELLEAKIVTLDSVSEEQFGRIAIQFDERDKRTEQLSQAQKEAANALSLASATAIAAALQAQKEAAGAQNDSNAASITKSEAAFTKQIDQITVLITAIQKGNDDKVSDLKGSISALNSRIDRGEGSASGARQQVADHRGSNTLAVAALAVTVTIVLGILAILLPHLAK